MTDPAKFIRAVWGRQLAELNNETPAIYGFLSQKDWETGTWRDFAIDLKKVGVGEVTLPDGPDVYFAPCLFAARGRRRVHALPSRWLYADLDEVDPAELDSEVEPTLAWETSPGRFQALWLLDRAVEPVQFEAMNRGLTRLTRADPGGWSTTKVLRVPGTLSTKYGRSRAKRFTVHMVGTGGKYAVQDITAMLPKPEQERDGQLQLDLDDLPDRKDVLAEWRPKLPQRARHLLSTKNVVRGDDRSARLWELYNLLLQAGMEPEEVLVAVQGTVWNKYSGQRRELRRLEEEIGKVAAKHGDASERERLRVATVKAAARKPLGKRTGSVGLKVEKRRRELEARGVNMLPHLSLSEFMQQQFPEPQWLVEGIWSRGAYGIWAGEYKSYKTVTLLDFLVSVASGRPFLDRFTVRAPGKVLYLHEEGREGLIQDRLHRIMSRKELAAKVLVGDGRKAGDTLLEAPADLPMDIASFAGFRLTDQGSQEQLVEYLRANWPTAVVMESWYLIAGDVNENAAAEVAPILDWLGSVGREHGCSIIVSHHYNKGSDDPTGGGGSKKRAGSRVSGSNVFSRWWESAVFIERQGEEDEYTARMEAQHRDLKGVGKQELQFEMDTEDENAYSVTFIDKEESSVRVSDPALVEVDLDHKHRVGNTTRITPHGLRDAEFLSPIRQAMPLYMSQGMPGIPLSKFANEMNVKWAIMRKVAEHLGYSTNQADWNGKKMWFILPSGPRAGTKVRGRLRQGVSKAAGKPRGGSEGV